MEALSSLASKYIAELIIPDYALSQPASFIISENQNLYEDINMISISLL